MKIEKVLEGAYDLHVHAAPDVVPRHQALPELAKAASSMRMAGILIKDHTTSTVGRCFTFNRVWDKGFRFLSSLALNPPVGGLNPVAVESALREGAGVIYLPTYGAANHITRWGAGKPPTAFPLPGPGYTGITLYDERKGLRGECEPILRLIAGRDAVMATGHISPEESLSLLRLAAGCGVRRMMLTHASESVISMSPEQQKEAAALGAFLEHSFFAVTGSCPNPVSLEVIRDQIRFTGVEKVILTSDFGQTANKPPVEGFCYYLEKMMGLGFSAEELRVMICDNPRKLLDGKRNEAETS
ncbi:MAG: hypothetical protein C4576_02535 [Desulfobacteraceae bacterium]|nr:MAG: hypothetical protein C4576_02535 [Desulfobacteraceae bacterium]